jgi:choline-sulfatase
LKFSLRIYFLAAAISVHPGLGQSRVPIILISVDTLRADRLSCYGYTGLRTSHIDAMATGGTLFSHISSQVPLTLPSHVSLFTSTYPFANRVRDNGQQLGPNAVTLATVLKAQGYRTAAFVASFVLDRRFGLDQGFDEYNSKFDLQSQHGPDPGDIKRPGEQVVQSAIEWLRRNGASPFFLFLHLYDLHTPYNLPAGFNRAPYRNRYDAALAYEDDALGRFWTFLEGQGLLGKTLIVFTSDHGESLDEHGESTHGYFVYQSTLWVPLIIHWPVGTKSFPATISDPAGLIDLAPTMLEFAGLARPREFQGHSLMDLLNRKIVPDREVYSESLYAQNHFGCSSLRTLRAGHYKYIEASRPELYDLARDPGELHNIFSSERAIAAGYRQRLRVLTSRAGRVPAAPRRALSPEAVAALKSLGYIGGESASEEGRSSGPDPKDRIGYSEAYSRALAAGSAGNSGKAAALMRELLAKAEDLTDVRISLGLTYQRLRQHSQAIEEFRRVLKQDPLNVLAHYNLGISLAALRQSDDAFKEFQAALAIEPQYTKAEEKMAGLLLERKDFDKARGHYEHVLSIEPQNLGASYSLGAIAAAQERWDDAVRYMGVALKISPASPEAHNVLGTVYFRRKQLDAAIREFAEAVRLAPNFAMAHYNLGLAFRQQGNRSSAAREFRLAIAADPQNQSARDALARLEQPN